MMRSIHHGGALKFVFFSAIAAGIGLFVFLHCGRDNPLDQQGTNFIPGSQPTAVFGSDTVRAFVYASVKIPIKCRDSLALGGKTPAIERLYLNWNGDSTSLSDSAAAPASDTLVHVFSTPGSRRVYLRAKDNDGEFSALARTLLIIDAGAPHIDTIQYVNKVAAGDTVTLSVSAHDTNGSVKAYIWSVNNLKDDTTTVNSFSVLFSTPGAQIIVVTAIDNDGVPSLPDTVRINVVAVNDSVGPVVTFLSPANNDTLSSPSVTVMVSAKDASGTGEVLINYAQAKLFGGSDTLTTWKLDSVPLQEGPNTIFVQAFDKSLRTNHTEQSISVVYNKYALDRKPPSILFATLHSGDTVYKSTVTVAVDVVDESGVARVTCNGDTMQPPIAASSTYTASVHLSLGSNSFVVEATDSRGNVADDTLVLNYAVQTGVDTVPPTVQIIAPTPNQQVRSTDDTVTVTVTALDNSGISAVRINGANATLHNGIYWTSVVPLVHGYDTIRVVAIDSSAKRNSKSDSVIVVRNSPPVMQDTSLTLTLGQKASITLCAADPEGDPLIFDLLASAPPSSTQIALEQTGGCVTLKNYTPTDTGVVVFRLRVKDAYGAADTALVRAFVTIVASTTPIFTNDTSKIPHTAIVGVVDSLTLTAFNPPGVGKLVFSLIAPSPARASVDSAGHMTWTPAPADTGKKTITARVSNGSGSDTLRWTVTVSKPDLPPTLANPGAKSVKEMDTLRFTLTASDSNGYSLDYSMASFPTGAKLVGNVFTWVPTYKQSGNYAILFKVREQRSNPLSDSVWDSIKVINVNNPPVLTNPGNKTVAEQNSLSFQVQATDVNGDSITFSMNPTPVGAVLLTSSGTTKFTWTPSGLQAGVYPIVIYAKDNGSPLMSDSVRITITVIDTTRPAFAIRSQTADTVFVGSVYRHTIRATDADQDALAYRKLSGPADLTVAVSGDSGIVTWQPKASDAPSGQTVSMIAADSAGNTDTLSWTIVVLPKWPRVFGGAGSQDSGFSVVQASDGGYALCGTASLDANGKAAFFMRTDTAGNPTVFKQYGAHKSLVSIQRTTDGGFVMCGTDSAAAEQLLLYKTNGTGDTLWAFRRSLGGSGAGTFALGASVFQTSDDGYIACGTGSRKPGPGVVQTVYDVYLVKIGTTGQFEWEKAYASPQNGTSSGYCVQQTSDGGYAICGEEAGRFAGNHVCLIKTDKFGNSLWTKSYGTGQREVGMSLLQTSDTGFVIGGFSTVAQGSMVNGLLIRVDSRGDTVWTFSHAGNSAFTSVRPTNDGNFIASGFAPSSRVGQGQDALLFKFADDSSPEVWSKFYGGTLDDGANSVFPTTDGGFVFTGYTMTTGTTSSNDVYLVKTDGAGNIIK